MGVCVGQVTCVGRGSDPPSPVLPLDTAAASRSLDLPSANQPTIQRTRDEDLAGKRLRETDQEGGRQEEGRAQPVLPRLPSPPHDPREDLFVDLLFGG